MMDLVRERMLMSNRKGSDTDMSMWEKVAESSDVVNEQSVTLSKPCTEITSVKMFANGIDNAFTSGKFEIWGR